MNKSELLEQLKELREKEYKACDNHNSKLALKFNKQARPIVTELEKIDGLIWTDEQWITSIQSDPFDNQEDARQNLLDKVSSMNGVRIVRGGNGVKVIEVLTATKMYDYVIHAHCTPVQVGTKKVENPFLIDGDKEYYESPVYETKWIATIERNVFNAYRSEFFY